MFFASRLFDRVGARNVAGAYRSSGGSLGVAQGKPPPGLMDSSGYLGQPRKQSLVIEDFYCVSAEPPPPQTAPSSLQVDALDDDSQNSPPPPGQGSSFLSEGEGPAQWLAAPKIDQDHGEGLSMELADDTSDSEGECGRTRTQNVSITKSPLLATKVFL